MSDRPFANDADLETQLSALGTQLAWAATPDVSHAIHAELATPTVLPAARRWQRWAAAAAAFLLLVGAWLAISSSARSTVADFFGIDGLRIERSNSTTAPAQIPNLGTPTSIHDFERWLPFTPEQPAVLGAPDAVYLRVLEYGDMLGITAWNAGETLPEAEETGLGAVLMQFTAPDDIYMMLKTVGLSTGSVTETTVDGHLAFWVEGASELTIFGGDETDTRVTANVLIWQQDGIGFRLETALHMDAALAIAESMTPIS